MDNYKTHTLFFRAITEKKLNELLKRADSNTGILESHINSLLNNLRCKVKVNKVYNQPQLKKNDDIKYCDIIIDYYDNKKRIGHMTLHLKLDDKGIKGMKKENGRLHVKNNINNSCYLIKCNKRKISGKNDSVFITLIKGNFIREKIEECSNATINILN